MSLLKTILEKRKKLKGEDPCWDKYRMVGLKPNGDPNCVGPVKETTSMQHAEMVTINSPGHHLHNKSARVFYKHDDGRVNVQVTHSKKKGHVTNLSLKPSQFVKGVVNLDKQMKEDMNQLDEVGNTNKYQKLLARVHKRAVNRLIKADDKRDVPTVRKNKQTADAAWERMKVDEAKIETDSGTANVTDTHVSFNNSGFRRKFSHQEIHKMDKGETVRGFTNEKDHPYADKHTSVYSNGDEEHHLPNDAKKSVNEEQIVEVKASTLQSYLQKRSAGRIKSAAATIFKGKDSPEVKSHEKRETGMERARKKLAPHYAAQEAERAKKQREELKKKNPPHEVKKRLDAAKAEYERSYGPVEKAGHQYAEGNGYYRGKELHAKYHALKHLHKQVSEARDWCGICGQTPCNCTNINEATSAAVRMQRALQKAKEDRERRERLAQPFVDKVFGKKEKDMKKLSTIREEAEQKVHPNALHVKPVKVGGQTKYHVHAVGKNFAHGIKVGEHLSDSELDDFSEMGGKIKHVK